MQKIKDRVILGALSGIIASAISKVMNAIEYEIGLTDLRFNQHGASLFLSNEEAKANTIEGKILASAVNNTMTGVTGTFMTYMLCITGRDYAAIKGAGVGIMQWIGMWGMLSKLGITIKSNKPLTHLLGLVDHIVFGASLGYLVSKLGDDSLFPEKKESRKEQVPLTAAMKPELAD